MNADCTQQVYEDFLQFEEENNLFESLQIKNVKIWKYIRFEIFDIVAHSFGRVHNSNMDKKLYEKQNTLKDWIDENVFKSQFRVHHKEVLIFNHARKVKEGKYYRCVYTDEWLKQFNKSYYVFELPYAEGFHFKPVRTKNLRYINQEKYAKIFQKMYLVESTEQKEFKRLSDYIIRTLQKEFKIYLGVGDRKRILQVISVKYVLRNIWRDYYGYLLKCINPKIIIYVIGYNFDRMILAELGKELGIPTVELQHGHIATEHIAYNFNNIHRLSCFPDYLFVSGQHEVDAMKRLPIPEENVYAVGSPELDLKTEYYKKKIINKKKKKKIITLISGGEYEIVDAAIELSQKLDADKYKVYFKLHPAEYTNWKKRYKILVDSDVDVVDDSKHDIYYYLAVSDFVIGIESTVLFEATRFECYIMILRKCWYLRSKSLVETGNAIYIDSMDDAFERIKSIDKKRRESDYFYCRNSCELIYEAVEDILNKKVEKGER